ncbi:MAG: autotransporter-associated beta strand repeat-containing protein [Pirellulales bacterium]|nr:autotransporter-associated beta strand repeat-containing protein [Pirellulales bacterium]
MSMTATGLQAATIYWDGTGHGLAAPWETVGYWSTDPSATTPDPAAVPGAGDTAVFNITGVNTAQTLNLSNNPSVGGIVVNDNVGGVVIQGNGVAGAPQNRIISIGAGGITMTSASQGRFQIGSTSSSGGTTYRNAAVQLLDSQTWTNNAQDVVGGYMKIGNASAPTTSGSVTLAAGVGARTLTLDGTSAGVADNRGSEIRGIIGNGGTGNVLSIVINGSGSWQLSSANTFTGGVTLNAGMLIAGANAAFGTTAGTLTLAGGEVRNTGALTFANPVSVTGNAKLTPSDFPGTQVNQTYSGAWTSTGAPGAGPVVTIGEPSAATGLATVFLSGNLSGFNGSFLLPAAVGSFATNLRLTGSNPNASNAKFQVLGDSAGDSNSGRGIGVGQSAGTTKMGELSGSGKIFPLSATLAHTLEVGALNTNSEFSGRIIAGGPISLKKVGTGIFTLSGVNEYPETTTIENGTLALSGSGSIATSPTIEVQTGAALDVSGVSGWTLASTAPQTLIGTGTIKGHVQDGFGVATISGGTIGTVGTLAFNNNLTLNGGGMLQFDLAHVNTIGGGVNDLLTVGGNLNLAGNTTLTVNSLDLVNGLASATYRLIDYTGTLTGNAANFSVSGLGGTRQNYTVSTATAKQVNLIVTGAPLSLTWKGNGTTNVWDLVGATNWNNNTQKFYNGDSVTFDDTGSDSPAVNLTGTLAPAAMTVNNTAKNYTFSGTGAIIGATGLTKSGSGKLIVANDGINSFSGAIAVNGGTLEVGAGAFSGTLGTGAIVLAAGTTLAFNRSDNQTPTNVIDGAGTLEQKGAGVLAPSGISATFTGPVKISAGTLNLAANPGTSAGLPDITDNGALQLGGTADWTPNRRIVGTGTIEKIDANTVTLTANNTNTGITTITAGTLAVGNGGADGALGSGDIVDHGVLNFNRAATYTVANNISGTGVVNYNSTAGAVTVTGTNTYDGATAINGGTAITSNASAFGSTVGGTTIGPANANAAASNASVAISGGITLAENFALTGRYQPENGVDANYTPHLQNLSGNNTLTGTISFTKPAGNGVNQFVLRSDGGLLKIGDGFSGMDASGPGGYRLLFLGSGNTEIANYLTGGYRLQKYGAGALTFSNANSAGGDLWINEGTVALTGAGALPFVSDIILYKSSATFDVSAVSTTPYAFLTQSVIGVGTIKGDVSGSNTVFSPSGTGTTPPYYQYNTVGGAMTIQGNYSETFGSSFKFKLTNDDAGAQNDKINVTGSVNLGFNSPTIFIVPGNGLESGGSYTLMTASSINYSGAVPFVLDPTDNTRYGLSLAFTSTNVKLNVTGANKSLAWSGTTADWDVKASLNWKDANPNDEQFYQADAVRFDDSVAGVPTTVNLVAGNFYPASITVDSAQNYVFSGPGVISGDTGITKKNSGSLTINTIGYYTGTVNIEGGTLVVGSSTALGSDVLYTNGVVINGGTLDLHGVFDIATRFERISVQGAGDGGNGALVNNAATAIVERLHYVTLAGAATFGGSQGINILSPSGAAAGIADAGYLHGNNFTLTKTGANTINLLDIGETNLGDININQGTLGLQGSSTLGNSVGKTLTLNGGTLALTDSTVAHAKPLAVGAANGTIGNAAGNSMLSGSGSLAGTLTTSVASGTTLTMSGTLSGLGGLTKTAPGTLVLSGANSYQGPTLVGAGKLELTATGQISTLSAITNNATFQVDAGTHSLGTIDGAGTMSVLGTSNVTAASITQGTLNIGGTVAASAAAVPEPGTWSLLLIGLLAAAGIRRIWNR